jgi:shikimate 5-dehydrogenase
MVEAENFDLAGFLDPILERRVRLRGQRAVVLGAGGAARAVIAALQDAGAQVDVAARRPDAAAALAKDTGASASGWPPAAGWNVLVNATPIGTWPDVGQSPLDARHLESGLVYDLVYNPPATRLLEDAGKAGLRTIGGLEMLVGQARRQLRWWTGRDVPAAVLDAAARAFLATAKRTETGR